MTTMTWSSWSTWTDPGPAGVAPPRNPARLRTPFPIPSPLRENLGGTGLACSSDPRASRIIDADRRRAHRLEPPRPAVAASHGRLASARNRGVSPCLECLGSRSACRPHSWRRRAAPRRPNTEWVTTAAAAVGGGWGGGATVQGSILTGEAREVAAEGQYNANTAVANSVNTDTAMRWNQYWYEAQQETARERHARLTTDRQRIITDYDKYHSQLRYNPSEGDIARGDALNAILDQVTDPKIHSSAMRSGAGMTVPAALVRDIPFTSPTQAVTFSLYNMTNDDEWPLSLKNDNLAEERKAFRDAVANALAWTRTASSTPTPSPRSATRPGSSGPIMRRTRPRTRRPSSRARTSSRP